MGCGTRCLGLLVLLQAALPFYLLDILGVPHGSSLNEAFLGVKGMVLKTDRPWFYPGSVTEQLRTPQIRHP